MYVLIEIQYYQDIWSEIFKLTYSFQSFSASNLKHFQNDMLNITFVLLECKEKMTASVIEQIKLIPIASEIKQVVGVYDIVVRLESTSHDIVKQTITNKIRTIDGIKNGITLWEMKSFNIAQGR